MANGGQVNYSIKFNVDKTSLTALNKELTQIQLQAAEMAKSPKGLTEELKKASDAASVLQDALNSSWNEKLNQINLNKFNTTLKNSGTTAQDLMQKLATGPANAQIAFNNLTRSLITTNVHLKTTSKILDSFAVTFKNTVRYGISSSIFNNLSNSISKAYDYSVKLDKSLNDIRIVSDKSAADMERFAVSANKAARELGRSTLDYAKASTIFFQQGLDDVDVEARTQATLKAANVTGQSGEAVSEQLTAVWNGYKVSAAETELYVDKLAAVAASTAADLEELSTGMSKVASAANIMGVDIDQLNAQLATVVSVTRQAPESVGTAFKTIYARMGDIKAGLDDEVTLGSYTEKMASFGINVLNANGELRDMGEVIEEIGGKWNTMSREQQVALSHVMAGQRQYNNLLSLFDNWDMYTKSLNTSKNAAGELQREQDIYMETTAAHLQQLRTETERTYATLFDKKAVNSFYDTTRVLLDEFNDWIEGMGGGLNAIINLASQLGIVFRKQIGDSILRNIDNVKNWIIENNINWKAVQKLRVEYDEMQKNLKAARAKQSTQAETMPAYLQVNTKNEDGKKENLYIQQVNKNTDELIAKNKELATIRHYLSDEALNETKNDINNLATLKDKMAAYKTIQQYAKNNGLDNEDKLTSKIEGAETGLKRVQDGYKEFDEILTVVRGNMEGVSRQQEATEKGHAKWIQIQKKDYQDALAIYDDLLLQAKDLGIINDQQYKQKIEEANFNKIFAVEGQTQDQAKIEREKLIADAIKLKGELAKRYNEIIKEGKNIEEAMDDETVKNTEAEITDLEAKINGVFEQGGKSKLASNMTAKVFGVTQALTSVVGMLQTVSKEGATGEEKLNGLFSGISGGAAAIANMIAPGSGFIVQGVAELIKGSAELFGIWDWGADLLASAEEQIAEANKALKELNEQQQTSINKNAESKDAIKYFTENEQRFRQLQELAEKGLLPDSLRSEYEGYLDKVQQYNKEALISYDAQGRRIASNANLMRDTVEVIKQANNEQLRTTFSEDNWEKFVKEENKLAKGYQKSKKNIESRNFTETNVKFRSNIGGGAYDPSGAADLGQVIPNKQWANAQSNTSAGMIDAYLRANNIAWQDLFKMSKEDLDKQKTAIKAYVNTQTQQKIDKLEKDIRVGGNRTGYSMDELKQIIQSDSDEVLAGIEKNFNEVIPYQQQKLANDLAASGSQIVFNKNFVANYIKYGKENSSYQLLYDLGMSEGKFDITQIIDGYIDGINTADYKTKNGGLDYNRIKKDIISMEEQLYGLLSSDPERFDLYTQILNLTKEGMSSSEYEKEMTKLVEQFVSTLDEDQFNKVKDKLAAMFNLSGVSMHWDSSQNRAVFDEGQNIYTRGEEKARDAARIIASQNAAKENRWDAPLFQNDNAENMQNYVESYLQHNLDEISLQRLDTGKFQQDFNDLLGQAIQRTELDPKYKINLDDIMKQALSAQGLDEKTIGVQVGMSKHADEIKKADLDTEELETYSKHLMDVSKESKQLSDDLEENGEAAVVVAKSIMRMNRGIEKLADNFDDWRSVLKKSDKSSQEYADAVDGMKDALADVFDVSKDAIPREFIEDLANSKEGVNLLTQAANGNAKAIDELRNKYSTKIFTDIIDTNGLKGKKQELLDEFGDLQKKIPKLKLGEVDDEEFLKGCQDIIANAGMTAEQATQMFNSMGFDVQFETEQKPINKTGHEQVTETRIAGYTKVDNFDPLTGDKIGTTNIPQLSTKTYPGAEYSYTDYIDAVAMSTDGKTPKIKSITKKGTGASNNYSSSNKGGSKSPGGGGGKGKGGGSSSKPKKIDKTVEQSDRYHKVNTQIEKTSNNLDKLEQAEEKALGGDWVKNLTQQFQQLNNQIANYNEKLRIAQGEQSELRSELAKAGVAFNTDGTISNYNAAFDAQLKKLNDLEDQYNHLSAKQQEKWDENKTLDKAKEDFSKFKENMDRYDELVSSFIPDLEKQIQEAIDQIVEKQIEKFNKGIDLRLDMAEAERDWNEFKTKVIDGIDEDDIIGQTQAKIRDFATYYDKNTTGSIQALTNHLNDIMNEMNKKVSNVYGKDDAKELEDLRKYYEELMDEMEGVFDLQKEIHENYLDMLDEAQDKFDEQVEAYEMVSDLIEHDMNLIELVYGEGAYTELGKFYEKQAENNKEQLEFQKQQVAFWREVMDSEEEGSKEWENAKEKWTSATSDLNDLIETSIKNLQDKYLNAIEGIFDKLNDEVTKGKGLDLIDTEWQLINKEADQYLDTINQLFETQALENKYLDAIDQTDNVAAQKKLKDLMDEELATLREKDKLTQYDIERANKRYEIALKQIALEEAQQNKSTMRLRRDSQGNYRYEYVADNDAIDQARDELEKLKNDLYNFDKAQYEESLNEMYDTWVEYQDALKEAAQINDPEERAAKEALIKEKYGDIINNMLAENAVIRQNLEQSAFEDLALLYDKNLEDYTNMTDAEKDTLMNDLVPAWGSGIQEMIDTMVGEGGFYPTCDEAFLELEHEQDNLSQGFEEIQDAGDVAFEAIANGTDTAIEKAKELIGVNEDVIDTYEEKVETMKNLTTQIDELANSFKKAGNEATNVIQKVHDLLKKTDEKNAAEYDKAAKAATTDKTVTNAINGNPTTTTTSAPAATTVSAPAAPTASSFKGISNISGHDALVDVVWGVWQGRYGNGTARRAALQSAYGVEGQKIIQGLVNNTQGYTKSKTKLGNRLSALGYDTGGYTGSWNNNGRLAFLHQKELVLNATDTENMLNAINVMRNLTNSVGIATLARLASLGASGSAGIGGNGLEQNVHISATFPNATSTREIEEALLNLTNRASQMIGRR